MAKRKSSRSSRSSRSSGNLNDSAQSIRLDDDLSGGLEGGGGAENGQTTGRMIMTVLDPSKDAVKAALKEMSSMTGLSSASSRVMYSSDAKKSELEPSDSSDANYLVLENLGIVILNVSEEESAMARTATPQDQNVVIEPEYWNHPLGSEVLAADTMMDADFEDSDLGLGNESGVSREFLLGARKMLDLMLEQSAPSSSGVSTAATRCFHDSAAATWGLQATRIVSNSQSGRGVRVAVLDTGFDASHPDFIGRSVRRATFIPASEPDNDVQDRNGHGTHCIGTSCGSQHPGVGPRYGVAYGADIFSGKVLRQGANGRAAGADGWILEGIDWALSNRCQVVSMSLGSRATSSQFPMSYERAAQSGLRAGTLILAATGNDSQRRFGQIAAVGRPANCPSIAAVAAVDSCLRVANFSNGQQFGNGGEVNFCGPGVAVLSSVPMPRRRAVFNGTSMATPHAAGIAALICGETGQTGLDLYREMRRRVLQLGNRRDFGNGLVRV